jgi:putative redox protein
MGTTTVSARWTGEALNYLGIDSKGNQVLMGKDHITPSRLLLMALGGCMGMDVLSILQKKRQNVTDVEVEIIGHQNDEHPRSFHTVEIKFNVKGDKVDSKAVARAIELSETKYCIVSHTLQSNVEIETAFEIEG